MKTLDISSDVTFVNAAELEKTAEGVIPLRFKSSSLEKFGPMLPIARMATSIEMQIGGTIKLLSNQGECR